MGKGEVGDESERKERSFCCAPHLLLQLYDSIFCVVRLVRPL